MSINVRTKYYRQNKLELQCSLHTHSLPVTTGSGQTNIHCCSSYLYIRKLPTVRFDLCKSYPMSINYSNNSLCWPKLDKQVRGRSDTGIPRRQSWNRHAVVLVASGAHEAVLSSIMSHFVSELFEALWCWSLTTWPWNGTDERQYVYLVTFSSDVLTRQVPPNHGALYFWSCWGLMVKVNLPKGV